MQDRSDLVKRLNMIGQVGRQSRSGRRAPARGDARRPSNRPAVLGNALSLRADAGKFLLKQCRALGPIFRVGAFNRRSIVLAGPRRTAAAEVDPAVPRRSPMGRRGRPIWVVPIPASSRATAPTGARLPWTRTSPDAGRPRPAIRFNSVVFPEPDGPISALKSPF